MTYNLGDVKAVLKHCKKYRTANWLFEKTKGRFGKMTYLTLRNLLNGFVKVGQLTLIKLGTNTYYKIK